MQETKTYIKLKDKPQDNFPEWIFVHHSAASEDQSVVSIENYHLSLGWEGIGYQYLITKTGEVYKGRPEHYHGSHVEGYNTKSIGICLIGHFDFKMPTEAQIASLRGLLEDLTSRYTIQPENIAPHRKFSPKSCYGKLLSDDWARNLLRPPNVEKVKQLLEEAEIKIKQAKDLL